MKQLLAGIAAALVCGLCPVQPAAAADAVYVVKPVAEKRVRQLPQGPLYWRIETFPTLSQAEAAIAPDRWNPNTVSYEGSTSLAAEVAGKDWLFTLGPKGGSTPGGTKVAEIGPVPPITAPEYLLRINYGSGPPGARTPQHSHPGSEAFYVISGQLGQRTPQGVDHVDAGHTMNGHPAGVPMEVFNSGTTDLTALIMFVADATKPFSSPAQLPDGRADATGANAPSSPPSSPEAKEVEAMVTKAAALIEAKGKAALAELRVKDSEWYHGDTYVFAYDLNGNVLLNPAFPAREGTNVSGQKDANGKLFHDAIIRTAETSGSGWVDYMFPKPGQTKPSQKWAFVKAVRIDGVPGLVASGFYPQQ